VNWSLTERETFCNGTLSVGCYTPHYVGDVFFFSCLIFLGTFILSFYLKLFRNTRFFPNKVSWLPSFFSLRISVFFIFTLPTLLCVLFFVAYIWIYITNCIFVFGNFFTWLRSAFKRHKCSYKSACDIPHRNLSTF